MLLFFSHTCRHTAFDTVGHECLNLWVHLFYKTSYIYCRCTNTQFNKILYVICKLELYKCEFLPILTDWWELCRKGFKKRKDKRKGREYFAIQLSKNSTCTFLLERKLPDYAKGSRCNLVSCAAQTPACCVNMIAFLWLSKEPRFQIYHTTFIFFPS